MEEYCAECISYTRPHSVNFYGMYFGIKSRFLLEFENITAVKSRIKKDLTNQKAQFDKLCGLSYP